MQDYQFKLLPFQNMYWSEEEKEARLNACFEDARNGFDAADVKIDGDILTISVNDEVDMSKEECLKRFKDVLIKGSLSLFAEPLF